jgi:hypothetical protein
MRRSVLLMTFALWSGLALLCLVGLVIMWFGEVQALVLPNATDVRIDRASLVEQHLTYRLPRKRTLANLSAHLVQDGWARDKRGESALRREHIDNATLVLFWRYSWFGLVPEVVTLRPAAPDQRLVDIQLIRCFRIYPWMRCL